MVRGCKKSIIYMKNTGSELFKEAYFILNEEKGAKGSSEDDMVSEANRIIEERVRLAEGRGKGFFPRVHTFWLPFLIGFSAACGVIIPLVIAVL